MKIVQALVAKLVKGFGLLVLALVKTSSRFSCLSQWKTRCKGFLVSLKKQEVCNGLPSPTSEKDLVDSNSLVEAKGVDVGQGRTEPL